MIYLWITLLAIASGILYRMGGKGGGPWYYNTKARDIGCSICGLIGMIILFDSAWWIHLISFVLLFGALTTYWDTVFGFDNHWFHGFACALAYFPYAIASGLWVGFGVRCIALAIAMGLVSVLSEDDVVEEVGRGAALLLTLPILMI